MSKLYGTLTNEDSKTSTRCARSIITAAAQSYEGSVSVTLRYNSHGECICEIRVDRDSNAEPGRLIMRRPLAALVDSVIELGIVS